MHSKTSSLISGLDPAALFALDAEEPAMTEWQPPSLDKTAKLFPQWQVIRLLGRGGMGAVYEMHQPELDRRVAVKLLPIEASRDEHLVERFRREARALAKLRHPGIVGLFESGITPAGNFYFVMEHVAGSPLSQWIAEGRLDVPKAIEIVRQVCEALAYAHAQGVIHRDIKPSNILLDEHGHARVADFGLARIEQAETACGALRMSRTGQFMGTPAYAAPEQVKDAAHVDHRADIYALGVLLYEMLTGDLPRGVFQPPSRKTGSSAHLDDVVRRAMQERPEDRYQAAAELKEDVISTRRISGKPAGQTGSSLRAAAIICISVLFFGLLITWRQWLGFIIVSTSPKIDKPVDFLATKSTGTPQLAASESQPSTPNNSIAPAPSSLIPPPNLSRASIPPPDRPIPPAPPPLTAAPVHVWSIEPVSPALMPPAGLTQQPWKDAVLTATGGAVLHPDGSISRWQGSQPNGVRKYDLHATAIASSGDQIFLLDDRGGLLRLGENARLAEGLMAIFSFPQAGSLPVLTMEGELFIMDPMRGTRQALPNPAGAIHRLTQLEDGKIWCLLGNGELLVLQDNVWNKPPESASQRATDLQAGEGFTLFVHENGRCDLHGSQVPDSPQRFRLPENAKNIRVGPQGRLVAW